MLCEVCKKNETDDSVLIILAKEKSGATAVQGRSGTNKSYEYFGREVVYYCKECLQNDYKSQKTVGMIFLAISIIILIISMLYLSNVFHDKTVGLVLGFFGVVIGIMSAITLASKISPKRTCQDVVSKRSKEKTKKFLYQFTIQEWDDYLRSQY